MSEKVSVFILRIKHSKAVKRKALKRELERYTDEILEETIQECHNDGQGDDTLKVKSKVWSI